MRKENVDVLLSEAGKFLIDIAKLIFGGVILASIMKFDGIDPLLLFILLFSVGTIVIIICFLSGLILLALSKGKED